MASKTNTNSASRKNKVRRARAGIIAVALLCGIPAAHDVIGTGAFFTDKASIDANTNVGTMDMQVYNLSDLDGNYGTIDAATGKTTGAIEHEGYQGPDFSLTRATDADNPSTGIINPGDSGIYAFKIVNAGEKSFDTCAVTTVEMTYASHEQPGGGNASAKVIRRVGYSGGGDPFGSREDEITIWPWESGMEPGKYITGLSGKYWVDHMHLAHLAKSVILFEPVQGPTLSGSLEKDGETTSAAFAYNAVLSREAPNAEQGAQYKVTTIIYAKQHRNSAESTIDYDENGNLTGTGDWAQIAEFETVN